MDMKKRLSLFLALCMALSLMAGCGSTTQDGGGSRR